LRIGHVDAVGDAIERCLLQTRSLIDLSIGQFAIRDVPGDEVHHISLGDHRPTDPSVITVSSPTTILKSDNGGCPRLGYGCTGSSGSFIVVGMDKEQEGLGHQLGTGPPKGQVPGWIEEREIPSE
jgi:hypothetical protein